MRIILASSSPYRKALLKRLNLNFEAISPEVDESTVQKDSSLSPKEMALELSKLKAKALASINPNAVIIGSDQVCYFKNQIFHKSGGFEQSFNTLKALSGQTHYLCTAVTVMNAQKSITFENTTALTMKELSDEAIKRYLKLDSPYDCAGSYKLEEHGISLFSQIDCSDQSSIVGLPLIELSKVLEQEFAVFSP